MSPTDANTLAHRLLGGRHREIVSFAEIAERDSQLLIAAGRALDVHGRRCGGTCCTIPSQRRMGTLTGALLQVTA